MKDYYKILQVDPSAEAEVIQSAYRRLAQKYHPDVDKSPDATRTMSELNEAHEVLSDPRKRAEYDQSRRVTNRPVPPPSGAPARQPASAPSGQAAASGLHIVVCVKQVPDWDIPPSSFKVDEAAKKVAPPPGVAPVPSQFDTIGVEAAMRIKDQAADARVTIMSMGPESARDAIKHSLAMGADEGVLLTDPAFEDLDWYQRALALSRAIKKLDDVELVICGRQAVDWDMGVTGSGIAELLGWPALTISKAVQVSNGTVAVERVLMDGFETVEAPLPAVVTVSNELGEPRYPKLQQIMQAAKKQVLVWSAADLGLDAGQLGADAKKLTLEKLYIPVSDTKVEIIEGDTPEEKAQNLAKKLAEAKLI